MLFWHAGGAIFLFRVLFKDPDVDLRVLVAGAILPDAVDLVLGLLVGRPDHAGGLVVGRLHGHSLLFATAVMVAGVLATHRGAVNRRRAVAAAVGIMFHLVLDSMWSMPDILLWPLPGEGLPAAVPDDWSGFPASLFDDPFRPAQEAIGLAYLIRLGYRAGLSDPVRRSLLWRTGRIAT